jgi:hypothetical protein
MATALSTAANRAWDLATKVAVILTVALCTASINQQIRLSVIESTRFTDKDGAALKSEITGSLPPEWLRQDMNEMKVGLKTIESGQHKLLERITRLETLVEAAHKGDR